MADSRLGALASEVIVNGTSASRLGAHVAEVLTDSNGVPTKSLAALSVETITNAAGLGGGVSSRRVAAITVEVLTPARYKFVGWGIPL